LIASLYIVGADLVLRGVWSSAEGGTPDEERDEGAAPLNEGAAPLNEGAAPLNEGAAPLNEGAAPLNEGAAPRTKKAPLTKQGMRADPS
jgi:hypothetical protein